jgi:hypothetical protein
MEQAARIARLERTKAETAAIIAAAAAAQKEAEERALVEAAAAAAEEQTKEEERNAERERRRKERKERERGEKKRHHDDRDREDNREKRLLKLVGAIVVKTMSKYRTRMDVDTFKKHAKEVGGIPTFSWVVSLTWLGWFTAHTYHCGEGEKVVELQGQ